MIVAMGLGLLGLVLIYLEFFMPGGILGVLGGIAFIASTVLFVLAAEMWYSALFIAVMIVLLILTIRLALWKIKQKPEMFARDEQSGYVASRFDQALIGKDGEALTNLRPSGHVILEGNRYQAVSESGYIKKGEAVKIIRGEGARLICRKVE